MAELLVNLVMIACFLACNYLFYRAGVKHGSRERFMTGYSLGRQNGWQEGFEFGKGYLPSDPAPRARHVLQLVGKLKVM